MVKRDDPSILDGPDSGIDPPACPDLFEDGLRFFHPFVRFGGIAVELKTGTPGSSWVPEERAIDQIGITRKHLWWWIAWCQVPAAVWVRSGIQLTCLRCGRPAHTVFVFLRDAAHVAQLQEKAEAEMAADAERCMRGEDPAVATTWPSKSI